MQHHWNAWLHISQMYADRVALAGAVVLLAELLLPKAHYSLVSRLRATAFWVVYIAITAAGFVVFQRLWRSLELRPLIHIDLTFLSSSTKPALFAAGSIVASLVVVQFGELFYYWFHRLQHASRFLWRFHAVHHSIRELSGVNSHHHVTEELFRIPVVVIPMSLLFSFSHAHVPVIWAMVFGWQGIYEHSSTRISLGFIRYLIPDNRFHRIHHSIKPEHHDCNFGSASALWDLVFGTAHMPRRHEWPAVGIPGVQEPKCLKEYLFMPWRRSNTA